MPAKTALLRNISTPYEEKYQTYDGNVTVTHFKRGLWSVHPRGSEPFMRGSKREAFDQAIGIAARHYPKRHHSTIGGGFDRSEAADQVLRPTTRFSGLSTGDTFRFPGTQTLHTKLSGTWYRDGATGGRFKTGLLTAVLRIGETKRQHSTIGESFGGSGTDAFWDLYEEELVKSVAKNPSDYALQSHESPEGYAQRVRQKFQSGAQDKGLGHINLDSPTFKRLARRLGIAKFSQRALKDAYTARGGKP